MRHADEDTVLERLPAASSAGKGANLAAGRERQRLGREVRQRHCGMLGGSAAGRGDRPVVRRGSLDELGEMGEVAVVGKSVDEPLGERRPDAIISVIGYGGRARKDGIVDGAHGSGAPGSCWFTSRRTDES